MSETWLPMQASEKKIIHDMAQIVSIASLHNGLFQIGNCFTLKWQNIVVALWATDTLDLLAKSSFLIALG